MQTSPTPGQFTQSAQAAVAEIRLKAQKNLQSTEALYWRLRAEQETRPWVLTFQRACGIRPGWWSFVILYTHLLSAKQTWKTDEAAWIAHLEYDTINMLNTNRAGGARPENLLQKRVEVDQKGANAPLSELYRVSPDYTQAVHHLPIRDIDTARRVFHLSRFPGHEDLPIAVILTALWAGMSVERTFQLAHLPATMVDAILTSSMRKAGH